MEGYAAVPLTLDGPLKKSSLSEKVYQLIKQQIIGGQLTPGEQLNIFQFAEQLQISRTPIKEAFNRLAEDGLLSIQPQRGTFVSTLSESEIKHLFDARIMIELWGIRRLCQRIDLSRLEKLSAHLKECEALLASKSRFDYVAFADWDKRFHEEIVASAQNPLLAKIYGFPHVHLLRIYLGRARTRAVMSHEQHHQILTTLKDGRYPEAENALTAHILSSRDDILHVLKKDQHPLVSSDRRDDQDPLNQAAGSETST